MFKQSDTDDLDTRLEPIVAVFIKRARFVFCLVPAIALAGVILAGLMIAPWLRPDEIALRWDFDPAGWIRTGWPLAVLAGGGVSVVLIGSRAPEFAVFKGGIKVPFHLWDPSSNGFYSWSEVSDCRWSPYEAGRLSIHVKAAEQHLCFCRVPEPHRAAVESAIRACGKWTD